MNGSFAEAFTKMLVFWYVFFAVITEGFDLQQWLDSLPTGAHVLGPAGTYQGNFYLNKPIDWNATGVILDGYGHGTVLTIKSNAVRLRNLNVKNSGDSLGREDAGISIENSANIELERITLRDNLFGIILRNSPAAHINGVNITGLNLSPGRRGDGIKIWYSPDAVISHCQVKNTRDFIIWYSENCILTENIIDSNRYGIHYMYSPRNIVKNNQLTQNSVGIYVMYSHQLLIENNDILFSRGTSGYGVGVKESDLFRVIKNRLIENRVAIHVDNSPLSPPLRLEDRATFEKNRLALNDIGVEFIGTGPGTFFHDNDFIDNWQQVSYHGSSTHQAEWESNYWSDYVGIDPNQDGSGTPAYQTMGLFDSVMDRNEGFRLFSFGPAVTALDFASKVIPWLLADPKAVDHSPRMQPHGTPLHHAVSHRSILVAVVLLSIVGVIHQLGQKI